MSTHSKLHAQRIKQHRAAIGPIEGFNEGGGVGYEDIGNPFASGDPAPVIEPQPKTYQEGINRIADPRSFSPMFQQGGGGLFRKSGGRVK